MIFLTLIAIGALVGLLAQGELRATDAASRAHRGAAGAFLAGTLTVGLASRPVGALDPVVLGIGALGAVVFLRLLAWLEQSRRASARP